MTEVNPLVVGEVDPVGVEVGVKGRPFPLFRVTLSPVVRVQSILIFFYYFFLFFKSCLVKNPVFW